AIAAAWVQVIVSDPLQAIGIGVAEVIEIGPKPEIAAVAETQAKEGPARRASRLARRLARRRARRRAGSPLRRRASGRANRSVTPLFQMSNQVPRLAPKPTVAAKASAVAARPAWLWVVAEGAAAAGGPILRPSTT